MWKHHWHILTETTQHIVFHWQPHIVQLRQLRLGEPAFEVTPTVLFVFTTAPQSCKFVNVGHIQSTSLEELQVSSKEMHLFLQHLGGHVTP